MDWSERRVEVGTEEFDIKEPLGVQGAQARVYRALRPGTEPREQVLIKICDEHHRSAYWCRLSHEQAIIASVHSRASVRLESHHHAAHVLSVLIAGKVVTTDAKEPALSGHCAVFEWLPGGSLEGWIEERTPIRSPDADLEVLRAAILGTIRGAAAFHMADTVHRDIKPDNVVLGGSSDAPIAKLVDAGSARDFLTARKGMTDGTSDVAGAGVPATRGYCPPEGWSGDKASQKCGDVYSIGTTCLVAIAGALPTNGNSPEEMRALKAKGRAAPRVHFAVREALWKAASEHPEARQADAIELLEQVEAYLMTGTAEATQEPEGAPVTESPSVGAASVASASPHRPRSRSWRSLTSAGVLAIALGALGIRSLWAPRSWIEVGDRALSQWRCGLLGDCPTPMAGTRDSTSKPPPEGDKPKDQEPKVLVDSVLPSSPPAGNAGGGRSGGADKPAGPSVGNSAHAPLVSSTPVATEAPKPIHVASDGNGALRYKAGQRLGLVCGGPASVTVRGTWPGAREEGSIAMCRPDGTARIVLDDLDLGTSDADSLRTYCLVVSMSDAWLARNRDKLGDGQRTADSVLFRVVPGTPGAQFVLVPGDTARLCRPSR